MATHPGNHRDVLNDLVLDVVSSPSRRWASVVRILAVEFTKLNDHELSAG